MREERRKREKEREREREREVGKRRDERGREKGREREREGGNIMCRALMYTYSSCNNNICVMLHHMCRVLAQGAIKWGGGSTDHLHFQKTIPLHTFA